MGVGYPQMRDHPTRNRVAQLSTRLYLRKERDYLYFNQWPLDKQVTLMLKQTNYANFTLPFRSNHAVAILSTVSREWSNALSTGIYQKAIKPDVFVWKNVRDM